MTFILKGPLGSICPGAALLFSHDALHRVSKSALTREKSSFHPSFMLKVNTP